MFNLSRVLRINSSWGVVGLSIANSILIISACNVIVVLSWKSEIPSTLLSVSFGTPVISPISFHRVLVY